MKRFVLLMIAPAFLGCAMTPNVNNRKAGQPWNYYGNLTSLYRDQTGGTKPALVWMDQVQFQRVQPSDFRKTVRGLLTQGYRKIGNVSVRSEYFVDPYEVKKLAADKGAHLVIGCWFGAGGTRSRSRVLEYWYQLLDKPGQAAPNPAPQSPDLNPAVPINPVSPINRNDLNNPGVY